MTIGRCTSCLSNLLLGICATIYLLLGLVIVAASIGTFVTPFGKIITPMYAISGIGGGIAIFVIACVGLCAACERKQRVCTLWLFTLLTFLMVVGTLAVTVIMFQYENVLKLAAAAGGDTGKANVDHTMHSATAAISTASTAVISTLATNAFYACNAVVNSTIFPKVYSFDCLSSDFRKLADTVNGTCMAPAVTATLNVSSGSVFQRCYAGATFPSWVSTDAFGNIVALSAAGLLRALNTPKGLFCACSSTLINKYVLPFLTWVKLGAIGVVIFFLFVFGACVHQICKRGCCGGNGRDETKEATPNFNDIQMSSYTPSKGKGKPYKGDGGYIARP